LLAVVVGSTTDLIRAERICTRRPGKVRTLVHLIWSLPAPVNVLESNVGSPSDVSRRKLKERWLARKRWSLTLKRGAGAYVHADADRVTLRVASSTPLSIHPSGVSHLSCQSSKAPHRPSPKLNVNTDMAPNDDPRRDRDRPEDNPFIAFRRFADSQVSSLLNTVFTLPATISNFNNAHVAREHCLFGSADKAQCEKLSELEERIADLRSEGRELYKVGDLQQVLKKGEDLMQLDRQADDLRRQIVEAGKGTEAGDRLKLSRQLEELQKELMKELGWNKDIDVSSERPTSRQSDRSNHGWNQRTDNDRAKQNHLVEKVANEKGQQWGWSWDWGFPRPFDQDDNASEDTTDRQRRCRRWRHRRDEARLQQTEEQWDALNKKMAEVDYVVKEELHGNEEEGQLQARRFFLGLPPPSNAQQQDTPAQAERTKAHLQSVFDEIGNAIAKEVPRILESPSYSPAALEGNDDLRRAGVHWRDAFEDLIRAEHGAPLIPQDHLGAYQDISYNRWARRFHDPSFARSEFSQWVTASKATPVVPQTQNNVPGESEEVSYEYAHDHEDQHDDPPTPKFKQGQWTDDMPETELDAYERLLGRTQVPGAPAKDTDVARPSVLSTLTTTERTVAPDGTVTTKVVLKKRFVDGREESSETVHTQRGQETDTQQEDPWKAMQDAQSKPQQETRPDNGKKSSWFWSS